MPLARKVTATVKGRLLSKNLAQRIEEAANEEPKEEVVEDSKVREEPKQIARSVVILDKPREAMVNQYMPVYLTVGSQTEFLRLGVDRVGGSLFHCILRAIYPPYVEWPSTKRLRKVKEFRQDLSVNFDGFYHRIDQKNINWPSLPACKKDLESSDGSISYEYLEYIGKIVNKCIVMTTVTNEGVLKIISGTRIYGKQGFGRNIDGSGPRNPDHTSENTKSSSPITYSRSEPMYVVIIHLGGPAYELLCLKKDGSKFTLFPESHGLVKLLNNSF